MPLQSSVSAVPLASITTSRVRGVDSCDVDGIAEAVREPQRPLAACHPDAPVDHALSLEGCRRQPHALDR